MGHFFLGSFHGAIKFPLFFDFCEVLPSSGIFFFWLWLIFKACNHLSAFSNHAWTSLIILIGVLLIGRRCRILLLFRTILPINIDLVIVKARQAQLLQR
jgi:hypothetical protein